MAKSETSKSSQFLKFALALLLIVGASVGATLFYYNQYHVGAARAGGAEPPPEVLPPPIFLPLDPFTVTLRREQRTRILHLAITLRLEDDASRQMILEYMPEVRDRVLRTLTEQHPDQVQSPEGREALVWQLSRVLEKPYLPQPKGPVISSVLFTAFVVQ